ncbi:DUF4055 domain-containing protein [Brevundimonas olei]|uniref:DUF4055 domain-containing protein n=1 Tax=Brevundimonas olei TaxID=657642 RepID=UPI0031DA527E
MTNTKPITEYSELFLSQHPAWKRTRDMIAGEDAVKAAGEAYLPRVHGQSDDSYKRYLKRVPFFPSTSRTSEGLLGLIFRVPPSLKHPDGLKDVFSTVTPDGYNFEDLAREVTTDVLATGCSGLLVDAAASNTARNRLEAEKSGGRPFIARYAPESILTLETGVVNYRQVLNRVCLKESDNQVRELLLEDNIYKVRVHTKKEGENEFTIAETIPTVKGQPLDYIPFYFVTATGRGYKPVKAPLHDLAAHNVHIYNEQADAKNSRFYSSAPMLTIRGNNLEDYKADDIVIAPGKVQLFEGHTAETPIEIKYVEFSGAGQQVLENAVSTAKQEAATLGSSILAAERSAVEAAETHAIRRASENSVVAAVARAISRKLTEAFQIVAEWHDGTKPDDIAFELNTDFLPDAMDAQTATFIMGLWQAGGISRGSMWQVLKQGELLPSTFDEEAEAALLDSESLTIDRPTFPAVPSVTDDENGQ